MEDHLSDKSEFAIRLYWAVVEALEDCGEFRLHPQKSRIGFISRMTFGGVKFARDWVDVGLITAEPIEDARVRRLEVYGPTSWGHTIRVSQPRQVDAQVRAWLCLALRRGDQETLDSGADVAPLAGHLLRVVRFPFRGRCDNGRVALPRYAADALAAVATVVARASGEAFAADLHRSGLETWLELPPGLGVGSGEEVDVLVTVA